MNGEVAQIRPVVDAAQTETRNQRIVAALLALAVVIPQLLTSFGVVEFTVDQLSDLYTSMNLFAGVLLVFMAQETKNTALQVEAIVTPTANPMKTVVEAA